MVNQHSDVFTTTLKATSFISGIYAESEDQKIIQNVNENSEHNVNDSEQCGEKEIQ